MKVLLVSAFVIFSFNSIARDGPGNSSDRNPNPNYKSPQERCRDDGGNWVNKGIRGMGCDFTNARKAAQRKTRVITKRPIGKRIRKRKQELKRVQPIQPSGDWCEKVDGTRIQENGNCIIVTPLPNPFQDPEKAKLERQVGFLIRTLNDTERKCTPRIPFKTIGGGGSIQHEVGGGGSIQ